MSLKVFHIVFISIAVLLSAFIGFWGINSFIQNKENGLNLYVGVISLIMAVVLLVYELKVTKKMKVL